MTGRVLDPRDYGLDRPLTPTEAASLVFVRTRLEAAGARRWRAVEGIERSDLVALRRLRLLRSKTNAGGREAWYFTVPGRELAAELANAVLQPRSLAQ